LAAIVDDALALNPEAADWSKLAALINPSPKTRVGDPMGRMFDSKFGNRAYSVFKNENRTLGEVGIFAANVLSEGLRSFNAGLGRSRMLIVYHGENRFRRSLLVLDTRIPPTTPARVAGPDELASILRPFSHAEQMRAHFLPDLTGTNDALEALWIARPRLVIAPAPAFEFTCVPVPPGQVSFGGKPSSVGACARDSSGIPGVTVCFHGTGSVGTAILIDGKPRTVDLASQVLDTCFVRLPQREMPTSRIGLKGPLQSRAPGAQENHRFWSGGVEKVAVVTAVDAGVPYHTPGRQLCVHSDPVTNYGDSGGALVNDYDELVGFAFQRTPFGSPIQMATWIFANSAFSELGLTSY
jgi:hypothetical protein